MSGKNKHHHESGVKPRLSLQDAANLVETLQCKVDKDMQELVNAMRVFADMSAFAKRIADSEDIGIVEANKYQKVHARESAFVERIVRAEESGKIAKSELSRSDKYDQQAHKQMVKERAADKKKELFKGVRIEKAELSGDIAKAERFRNQQQIVNAEKKRVPRHDAEEASRLAVKASHVFTPTPKHEQPAAHAAHSAHAAHAVRHSDANDAQKDAYKLAYEKLHGRPPKSSQG